MTNWITVLPRVRHFLPSDIIIPNSSKSQLLPSSGDTRNWKCVLFSAWGLCCVTWQNCFTVITLVEISLVQSKFLYNSAQRYSTGEIWIILTETSVKWQFEQCIFFHEGDVSPPSNCYIYLPWPPPKYCHGLPQPQQQPQPKKFHSCCQKRSSAFWRLLVFALRLWTDEHGKTNVSLWQSLDCIHDLQVKASRQVCLRSIPNDTASD